ncbi:hypothetical protein [Serratia marcescens]|uniref:hypothetical protein n=1 Tax=Serratia marcescens TaxID=615 RepID=UPI0023610ADA|nr:hypothetical protein [Serratia marcescens]
MTNLSELSKPVVYSLRFRNVNGEPDKTINANTTFSTLEKAKAYGLGSRYVTQDDGKIVSVRDPSQDPIVEPLYSQEYVSALKHESAVNWEAAASLNVENQELKKRIAELEAIRADASQVFKEIGNELGCNPDNESIMMAIDALKEREKRVVALAGGNAELWETMAARLEAAEAKLATPVRLPRPGFVTCSGERHYTYGADEVKGAIHAAGFTVEDKQ